MTILLNPVSTFRPYPTPVTCPFFAGSLDITCTGRGTSHSHQFFHTTAVKILTHQFIVFDPLTALKIWSWPFINHARQSPGEPLTISKLPPIPTLTTWPASNFALTTWPHFDPSYGWEYSQLCSVPPLMYMAGNSPTVWHQLSNEPTQLEKIITLWNYKLIWSIILTERVGPSRWSLLSSSELLSSSVLTLVRVSILSKATGGSTRAPSFESQEQ